MIDPKALGAAVQAWLDGDVPSGPVILPGSIAADILDEADARLDKVCVEQGLYKAGDSAYFEPESREHGLVHIFLDGTILQVDVEGNIERF